MAKAVIGAVEIAAGIVLEFVPGGQAFGIALILAGIAEEAAYIAQELQGNPTVAISAKLPSAAREGIYGQVRKGCVFIYQSTTGHQLNEVCAWAAHACQSIVAMYVDQRKFYYDDTSSLSVRSPYGGGNGDGNTYQDDSGNNYNFGSQIGAWHNCAWSCEASPWTAGMTASRLRFGDNASSFVTTVVGVTIGGTTYAFGCVSPGTAGSSSSVFSSATNPGDLVTDGGVTWVNLGPAPGGYWLIQLHNQDTTQWANNCTSTGLCTTYFKCTYDANLFEGPPQLRATIQGKNNIYDPRSGTRGFTSNAALCIADLLCDSEFGFGVDYATGIDEDQLIAAANLCDEQVKLADQSNPANASPPWAPWTFYSIGSDFTYGGTTYQAGASYTSDASFGVNDFTVGHCTAVAGGISGTYAYENRYEINGYFNTQQEPGQILSSMLMACEGRVTRQGGVYKIYPAAWYGTSLTFDQDDLCGGVKWQVSNKFRDRVNCVRATFVCPQYPYNVSGYSKDHPNTNIFEGEWQPTDAPPYAQDYLHGYGVITDPGQGDVNLVEDGLVRLYQERRYQFVTSAAQCQRLMKIYLMRNRYESRGKGTLPMKLSALQAQSQDVLNFTFAALGLESDYLEISRFGWVVKAEDDGGGGQGARAVQLSCSLDVVRTDPSIYEWSTAEEMTLFDQPSPDLENPFAVSPPTALSAESDLTTALVTPDGKVTPRIKLTWTEPADPFVTTGGTIQIQITPHSAGTWADAQTLAGDAHLTYLGNVTTGSAYDVRMRGVRADGAYSAWLELDNIVCGVAVDSTGFSAVAPDGTVTAVTTGPADSTIYVAPFAPNVAGFTATCTPSPSALTGESPQTLYYVYYIDPTFAGGTITPIATTDPADFVGKPGYFLIGSVLTPAYVSGSGSGTRYYPSNYNVLGQMAPNAPGAAYDGNLGTYAAIFSSKNLGGSSYGTAFGELLFEDFPAGASASGVQLFVSSAARSNAGGVPWAITASVGTAAKPAGPLGSLNSTGAWAALTAYALWDTFTQGGATYLVVTGYTSGSSFGSTDAANACVLLAYGTGNSAQTLYSFTLPTGTAMSSVTVDVTANPPSSNGIGVAVDVYEVYLQ
jgi:hypothetical protein